MKVQRLSTDAPTSLERVHTPEGGWVLRVRAAGDPEVLYRQAHALEALRGIAGVAVGVSFDKDSATLLLQDVGDSLLSASAGDPARCLTAAHHLVQVLVDVHARGWTLPGLSAQGVVLDAQGQPTIVDVSSARPADTPAPDLAPLGALLEQVAANPSGAHELATALQGHAPPDADDARRCLLDLAGEHRAVGAPQSQPRPYGRSVQVRRIGQALHTIAQGGVDRLALYGAGSSDVRRLLLPLEDELDALGIRVAAGVRDPSGLPRPLGVLAHALDRLLQRLLNDPGQAPTAERVRLAMAANGNTLAELLPSTAAFGPPRSAASPLAFEHAVLRALRALLQALTHTRPLVLVLGGLEHESAYTIRALVRLATDPALRRTALLLSWDPARLTTHHPLRDLPESLDVAGAALEWVPLGPLADGAVERLLADALGQPAPSGMAGDLFVRSAGHPQALRRLLALSHAVGALQRDGARWTWDGGALAAALEDPVAELTGVSGLQILATAAHMGQRGDASALARVMGLPLSAVQAALAEARAAGVLGPSTAERWRFDEPGMQRLAELQHSDPAALCTQLAGETTAPLTRAHHLLQAARVEPPKDRDALATALARAATRAAELGAFGHALALELERLAWMPGAGMRRVRLTTHQRARRLGWLSANPGRTLTLVGATITRTRSALERASLTLLEVDALHALGRSDAAVARTRAVLGTLPPWQDHPLETPQDTARLRAQERDWAIARIRSRLSGALQQLSADLGLHARAEELALAQVRSATPKGGPQGTGAAMVRAAAALRRRGQPELAHALIAAASERALGASLEDQATINKMLVTEWLVDAPISERLPLIDQATSQAMGAGRLGQAAETRTMGLVLRLLRGDPLQALALSVQDAIEDVTRAAARPLRLGLTALRQMLACLRGRTRSPHSLVDLGFDEALFLAEANPSAAGAYDVLRALARTVNGKPTAPASATRGVFSLLAPLATALRAWTGGMGLGATEGLPAAHQAALRAEEALSQERLEAALRAWDQALAEAQRSELGLLRALIADRASRALGERGLPRAAKPYQELADRLWEHIGAELRSTDRPASAPPVRRLAELYDATQSVGSALEPGALALRITHAAWSLSGARRAVLVLEQDPPVIRAVADADQAVEISLAVDADAPLSLTALEEVRRTLAPWVLDPLNPTGSPPADPWLHDQEIDTLVALPLLDQSVLRGVILLEGRRDAYAFPPDRLDLLRMFTAPAAQAMGRSELVERLRGEAQIRQRIEHALRQSELRYQGLFQAAPEPVLLVQSGGIVECNRSARRALGGDERYLTGRAVASLFHDDAAHQLAELERSANGVPSELDALTPEGPRTVSLTVVALPSPRAALARLTQWVLRDVHRERQVEAAMLQSKAELEERVVARTRELLAHRGELEARNAELRQFAYLTSHDLKAPLRTVTSYLSLLQRRHADDLPTKAQDYLGRSVAAALRMQGLIDDLLSFSQIGQENRELEPCSLTDAVDRALLDLEGTLRESGGRVDVGPLPTVMGIPTRLHQLFQNLIGNALKYRHADRAPEIRVRARQTGAYWRVSIQDNGIGVPPDRARIVFAIFKRLHGRGTYSGSGIGLALCKRIVERHGGAIWIDPEPSAPGCTVHLTLPVVPPE
jgi:signal transduction histidine kinase